MSRLIIPPKPDSCELCQRPVSLLTKHHLIPKTMHKHKRVKKLFARSQCITDIAWLCQPCHKHIHKVLSEKQMAFEFYQLKDLATQPDIANFVAWIKDKPAEFRPKT